MGFRDWILCGTTYSPEGRIIHRHTVWGVAIRTIQQDRKWGESGEKKANNGKRDSP